MQRIHLASAMILIALVLECRPVSLSPVSTSPKQSVEKRPPDDRLEAASGQPQSSIMRPASNPSQFHQPTPANGMSAQSRPSSQMFDTRHSMQPKDSSTGSNSNGPPNRQDINYSNLGETVRRQNLNNPHKNLSYARPDLMIEGSGMGPSWTNEQNPKSKMDDTEDSGDDDEDKDDDYDYGDTLESGSGHGQIVSTTQTPSSIGRIQSNEFHSPFRQPSSITDSKQTVSTLSSTKLIITTRAPARISQTATMAVAPSSTTPTSTSTPRQTSTPSRNLLTNNNRNKTRGEVDYDYEDGNEDDDSEDSSVFEDNEAPEVGVGKSNSTSQLSSTSNPGQTRFDIVEPKERFNTTKLPSYTFSGSNQNLQFSPSTESSTIPTKYYTTQAPVTLQMMTKPAIAKPTPPQMSKPDLIPGAEVDLNSDDDKRAPEDDEDDDDEQEDDDQKDDMEEDTQDDDDPHKASQPSDGSLSANKHIKPNRPSRPNSSSASPTNQTITPSSRPKVSPSQEKQDKSTEFQTSTTTSKPNVIIPSTPTTHLPVPILPITTTTVTPTTPKLQLVTSPRPTVPAEAPTVKTTSFAQPAWSSTTSSSTTSRPAPNFGTDKTATRFTTSTNMQPANSRSPQSKATASVTQYENSDTLTRQVYEKAVEVYQEADRTVRAAWQAVWPPDINLDSSVMEPLLNQPLFFMLALGGTVICFVLLFLLVVYIITYQIQPKDDDSSIY